MQRRSFYYYYRNLLILIKNVILKYQWNLIIIIFIKYIIRQLFFLIFKFNNIYLLKIKEMNYFKIKVKKYYKII